MALAPARIAAALLAALLLAGTLVYGPGLLERAQGPAAAACAAGESRRLVETDARNPFPRTSGEWVVFARDDAQDSDVHAVHLPTGAQRVLAEGPAFQSMPLVHAGRAVWREQPEDGGAGRIVEMRLPDGEKRVVALPEADDVQPFGLHGDTLLVQSVEGEARRLLAHDLAKGTTREVAAYDTGETEVWGTSVVWVKEGAEGAPDELVHHDLASGRTETLLTYPGLAEPDVSGRSVVYMQVSGQDESDDWDVYHLRLDERTPRPVATNVDGPALQQDPRVHGEWVVYLEAAAFGTPKRLAHHLPTGETRDLSLGSVGLSHEIGEQGVVATQVLGVGRTVIVFTCL